MNITMNFTVDNDAMLDEIIAGDIVAYDDGILAVVLDMLDDSLYLFNENGCVEKVKTEDVTLADEYTDLVDMMMLKLQHTEV